MPTLRRTVDGLARLWLYAIAALTLAGLALLTGEYLGWWLR